MKGGKEKECQAQDEDEDTETTELLVLPPEQEQLAPVAISDAATFAALQAKARSDVEATFKWVDSGLEETCNYGNAQAIRFYNEKTPYPEERDPSSSSAKVGPQYFTPRTPQGRRTDIATVITLYNEERDEAERTLESLAKQDLAKGTNHAIVLICDGVEKMSLSMKEYLVSLFPNAELEDLLTVHSDRLFRVMTEPAPKPGGAR